MKKTRVEAISCYEFLNSDHVSSLSKDELKDLARQIGEPKHYLCPDISVIEISLIYWTGADDSTKYFAAYVDLLSDAD